MVREMDVLITKILQGTEPNIFEQNAQLQAPAANLASAIVELDNWTESEETDIVSLEEAKGGVNAAYSKLCKTKGNNGREKKSRKLQEQKEDYCNLLLLALEDIQQELNASQ